jgi:hypothetical protein
MFMLSFFLIAPQIDRAAADPFSGGGPSGVTGGVIFNDLNFVTPSTLDGRRVVELRVRSGDFIDAIQVVYQTSSGQIIETDRHGGPGGVADVFKFDPDEYIVEIKGKYGAYVDSLEMKTSKGRIKRWGGNGGVVDYIYIAPAGHIIQGFFGRSGAFVDNIGVIYYQR